MRIILLFTALFGTYQVFAQNVGIGTLAPSDKLHINAATGEDPLRVQVNGATKLRVWNNGGVSVGNILTPPTNGLLVNGVIQPTNGIETPNKLIVESTGDSIILNAGGSQVIIAADGNIIIKAPSSKITIEAGANLELSGVNVSIEATGSLNLQATGNIGLQASGINMNAGLINLNGTIRFNGGSKKVAGLGDPVIVSLSTGQGIIQSGSPNVFTN